jgi:hypothetical protein
MNLLSLVLFYSPLFPYKYFISLGLKWADIEQIDNVHNNLLPITRKQKPFDAKKLFNGFKMFSFRCKSHVKEIILPKNMFGCQLKLILEILGIFYISSIKPKYSYTIMYECEKSPLTHEVSYIGLFNFYHLSLFHVNVICKK